LTDCYGDSIVSRATASYGCSALGPVILGVNFEGSERADVAERRPSGSAVATSRRFEFSGMAMSFVMRRTTGALSGLRSERRTTETAIILG
jgi:hypothetical protein